MFISLVSWWYSAGWRREVARVADRLEGLYDYFSLDLLVKTLFAPFRQISAGSVNGSLEVKFRAFIDRVISRLIGAMIRTAVLLVGVVTIILTAVFSVLLLVLWSLVPLLPLVGLVLAIAGWIPW